MENFDYNISLLELVGPMHIGVGLMLIVKNNEETYEALFWVSSDTSILTDKFIMPIKFLEKEGITRFVEHPQYEKFMESAWKVLPNREVILKEAEK